MAFAYDREPLLVHTLSDTLTNYANVPPECPPIVLRQATVVG